MNKIETRKTLDNVARAQDYWKRRMNSDDARADSVLRKHCEDTLMALWGARQTIQAKLGIEEIQS